MTAAETPKATKAPTPAKQLEAWIRTRHGSMHSGWYDFQGSTKPYRISVTLPLLGVTPPQFHLMDARGEARCVELLPVTKLGTRLSGLVAELDALEDLTQRAYGMWALRRVLRWSGLTHLPAFLEVVNPTASPRLVEMLLYPNDPARWPDEVRGSLRDLRDMILGSLTEEVDGWAWRRHEALEVFAGLDDAPQPTPATTTETTSQETAQEVSAAPAQVPLVQAPQVQPPQESSPPKSQLGQELHSQLGRLASAAQDFANALRDKLIRRELTIGPTSQEIEKRLAELRAMIDDQAPQEDQAPAPPTLADVLTPSLPVLKRCASSARGSVCGIEAHTEDEVERLFGWRWIGSPDTGREVPQGVCRACKSALNKASGKARTARRSQPAAPDLRQADLLQELPPPPPRPDYFARLRSICGLVIDGQWVGEGITTSRPPKLSPDDPERLVVSCEAGALRCALSPLGEWTVRAEERPKLTPTQLSVWARAAAVVSVALEIDAHAHISDGPGLTGLEWTRLIKAVRAREEVP